MLWKGDGFERCPSYSEIDEEHCTVYSTRPRPCRDYPRVPMDLDRSPNCGYTFIDGANGKVIDKWMDKRVHLTLVGNVGK